MSSLAGSPGLEVFTSLADTEAVVDSVVKYHSIAPLSCLRVGMCPVVHMMLLFCVIPPKASVVGHSKWPLDVIKRNSKLRVSKTQHNACQQTSQ